MKHQQTLSIRVHRGRSPRGTREGRRCLCDCLRLLKSAAFCLFSGRAQCRTAVSNGWRRLQQQGSSTGSEQVAQTLDMAPALENVRGTSPFGARAFVAKWERVGGRLNGRWRGRPHEDSTTKDDCTIQSQRAGACEGRLFIRASQAGTVPGPHRRSCVLFCRARGERTRQKSLHSLRVNVRHRRLARGTQQQRGQSEAFRHTTACPLGVHGDVCHIAQQTHRAPAIESLVRRCSPICPALQ